MNTNISFREFIRLIEEETPDPVTNNAIIATAKTIDGTPQGKEMSANDVLNTAAKQSVFQGKVKINNALNTLKVPKPGIQPTKMMKKK